jgi:hypothetical protein
MKKNITQLTLALGLLFSLNAGAQSSATSTPNSVLNSTTSTGSYTWAIGSATADCNLGSGFLYALSKGLELTNFNFSIPTTATIIGITSKITYSASVFTFTTYTQPPKDTIVKLIVNGVQTGNNLGQSVGPVPTTPPNGNYKVYGSPTSTWGISNLTPANVNSPNFGVAVYLYRVPYQAGISTVLLNNTASLTPNPTPSITVYYATGTGIIESQSSSPSIYSFNKTIYFRDALPASGDLYIYNLLGEKVYHTSVEANQNQIQLNDLSAGIYVYKLKVGSNEFSQKIRID